MNLEKLGYNGSGGCAVCEPVDSRVGPTGLLARFRGFSVSAKKRKNRTTIGPSGDSYTLILTAEGPETDTSREAILPLVDNLPKVHYDGIPITVIHVKNHKGNQVFGYARPSDRK